MPKRIDLTGKKFGKWIVISFAFTKDCAYWNCKCDCERSFVVKSSNLICGGSKQCSHCRDKIENLVGKIFGALTVESRATNGNANQLRYNCTCSCGNKIIVHACNLKNDHSRSCKGIGCIGIKDYGPKKRQDARNRKLAKIQRIPLWSNLKEIKKFYDACPNGYHVDHIIPLRGKFVSGLHVINNLQYLPEAENVYKGNYFVPGIVSLNSMSL